MELGIRIKQHRTARGLSQEDLAGKIYVSRQTVSNWETDKTYPDVESLLLLSSLFDVSVDELIKGDTEAMEKIILDDSKKMDLLNVAGGICGILAAVFVVGGISFWDWGIVPSSIIGVLLIIGYFITMTIAGSIRRKHDLVTFRELVAFSKGEPIDRDNPRSQRARRHRALKTAATALITATIGAVVGYYAYVFFG
ncbi:helix-turn-helix domain-containing protein [Senegalimassilia anaerobia]|uniref:helix-turn-helix domain-containing protein n=1 Tax=Senegalimassilia anaerobia TaxID=1473216 RepID=UPI003A8ED2E2